MPWTVVWSQRIRVEGEEVLNLEHSWFCQQINLFAPALIIIHEVEERVCDEMINVSDNVHDDEVETAQHRSDKLSYVLTLICNSLLWWRKNKWSQKSNWEKVVWSSMLRSKGIDQRVQITMNGFVHNISLSKCSNVKEDSRFCPVKIRNSRCWDFWQPTGTLCWLQRLHHLQPEHPDIYSEGSNILPVCDTQWAASRKFFCMRNMWRHLFHDCNPETWIPETTLTIIIFWVATPHALLRPRHRVPRAAVHI